MASRKSKSTIWNFFERSVFNPSLATCLLCKNVYKTSGNTTNLQKHIKSVHKESVKSNKTGQIIDVDDYTSDDEDNQPPSPKRIKQRTRDLQPFKFVEDEGFRELLYTLDPKYVVPCSKTIKTKLNEDIFNKIFECLSIILEEVKYVSLTTDLWTSAYNNDQYCTITCHFIYKGNLEAAVLDTVELPGSHTAVHLKDHIEEVALKFKIKQKIVCIVTDNAANCKLACSLLQVPHLPCFAHTLNLVVGDSISDVKNFSELICKVRNIVTFFKRSNLAMSVLREEQRKSGIPELKPLKDVATRWNSILTMLCRTIEIGGAIILALAKCSNSPPSLNSEETDIMKEAVCILKIFEDATKKISGEQYPTVSLIIPIVLGIHSKLSDIQLDLKTDTGKSLLTSLKASVVKRLFPYEQRNTLQLASILDPRVKKIGFRSSENADQAQDSLQKEIIRTIGSLAADSSRQDLNLTPTSSVSTEVSNNTKADDIGLFKFLEDRKLASNKQQTLTSEAIILVRQYLELPPCGMEANPLEYWRTSGFKHLDFVANKYLCVPASSVPSERIFSKTGQIISEKRSRLKSKNVNTIVFVGKNYKFLQMQK